MVQNFLITLLVDQDHTLKMGNSHVAYFELKGLLLGSSLVTEGPR